MNRILEHSPSDEESVVSRILILVHKTIDDNFPNIQQTDRQFTKTVFSEDGESTAMNPIGYVETDSKQSPPATPFSSSENTDEIKTDPDANEAPEYHSKLDPTKDHLESDQVSRIKTKPEKGLEDAPDWISLGFLGACLAGILMIIYVVFFAQT